MVISDKTIIRFLPSLSSIFTNRVLVSTDTHNINMKKVDKFKFFITVIMIYRNACDKSTFVKLQSMYQKKLSLNVYCYNISLVSPGALAHCLPATQRRLKYLTVCNPKVAYGV